MALIILFALHVLLSIAAIAFLWTRVQSLETEVRALRRGTARVKVAALPDAVAAATPWGRAAKAWGLTSERVTTGLRGVPTLSPETGRGLTLALMATAPAIAFFFAADPAAIVASGLMIATAMMLIALRPIWRAAAWASVFTAGAWALVGFALGAAHADPASYAICIAAAGMAGVVHAHLRRATPGATLALSMAAAVLALGSQIGMVGAPGLAFGAIVATAAIVGAMSLRLEAMHLAAFGAAVIGLFVLSGQPSAAIWFTPAAAWAGALFLAIATLRVPQLGARGVALAGTGAFAPLGVIAALNAAQHGLANVYAAAGAFVWLAAVLSGLIALAATRRDRGLAALRVTLWVLVLAAFIAVSAAVTLALPPQLAAPAFALVGLGLGVIDGRLRDTVWRVFAVAAGGLAVLSAITSAQVLLREAAAWPAWVVAATGLALPAAIAAGAAFLFAKQNGKRTAASYELVTIALAVAAANVLVRLAFSNGATLLNPISFVEAGVHTAMWLAASLGIAWRAEEGATGVRGFASHVLGMGAVGGLALAAGLNVTSLDLGVSWVERDSLGFLIPGALLMGHWVFWRTRGADTEMCVALAAGAFALASSIAIELMNGEGLPSWAQAVFTAVAFALAIGVNFAPFAVDARAATPRDKSPSLPAKPAARSDAA